MLGLAAAAAQAQPPIVIPRVSRAPTLQDFVDHRPREAEAVIRGFVQREPGDGIAVSQPTTAYLSYDQEHLYAVFVCEEGRRARTQLAKREAIAADDQVGGVDRHVPRPAACLPLCRQRDRRAGRCARYRRPTGRLQPRRPLALDRPDHPVRLHRVDGHPVQKPPFAGGDGTALGDRAGAQHPSQQRGIVLARHHSPRRRTGAPVRHGHRRARRFRRPEHPTDSGPASRLLQTWRRRAAGRSAISMAAPASTEKSSSATR